MAPFILMVVILVFSVKPVSAGQFITVECQDKTCWTSQSIKSDIKLSLVPGQSVLESWQITNHGTESVKVWFKVIDRLSSSWSDQPLQFALNGEEIELNEWQTVALIEENKTSDLNLQVRLDPSADNTWQNHLWQLEVELMSEVVSIAPGDGSSYELEPVAMLAKDETGRILGIGVDPESINSRLSRPSSSWMYALIGVLVPLVLILLSLWFVRVRQGMEEKD